MRARIENSVLYLHKDDVPPYKKKGSMVRNSYFWALRSFADRSNYGQDWEYSSEVWLALQRTLIAFAESGYLGWRETNLEFSPDYEADIPDVFRLIATWEQRDDQEMQDPAVDHRFEEDAEDKALEISSRETFRGKRSSFMK